MIQVQQCCRNRVVQSGQWTVLDSVDKNILLCFERIVGIWYGITGIYHNATVHPATAHGHTFMYLVENMHLVFGYGVVGIFVVFWSKTNILEIRVKTNIILVLKALANRLTECMFWSGQKCRLVHDMAAITSTCQQVVLYSCRTSCTAFTKFNFSNEFHVSFPPKYFSK